MHFPSITTIISICFLAYIVHSTWLMAQLFMTLKCSDSPCFKSFLDRKPRMQLALFITAYKNPDNTEIAKIYSDKNFNYLQEFQREFEINVPAKTRRNGTLLMQVVLALAGEPLEWRKLSRDGPTVIHTTNMVEYMVPRLESFNLLNKGKIDATVLNEKTLDNIKTVNHLLSKVHISLLTDSISLSVADVPPELARLIHINRNQEILPILKTDFFETRINDLIQVEKQKRKHKFKFIYKPIGIGKLRLMLMVEHAMSMMQNLGFTKKDVDEVKGLLSETNVYLLCGSIFIASIHIFFDFLSFKNDVIFWRKRNSYEGISTRTTLWRAFSQIIIFFYLLEEDTSMLVVIPTGLGVLIEVWKCKKILKLKIGMKSAYVEKNKPILRSAEKETEQFDKEGMHYLSYILYPLIIGGAIYSLIYQPHRSWYSWTLNSLVNGVYAFGFLFMMPQLFINYKLKSVAALPWRAFMYKAFNTFIDDFFAFIISMPTAHRVACLRDDVVFLIYLYQRWLYPVDKNRLDIGLSIEKNDETDLLPIEAEENDNVMDIENTICEHYEQKIDQAADNIEKKQGDEVWEETCNIAINKKDN